MSQNDAHMDQLRLIDYFCFPKHNRELHLFVKNDQQQIGQGCFKVLSLIKDEK